MNAVEEVAKQFPHLFRLLPRREVSGFRDDFHLTARDVLLHQFRIREASQKVFVSGDDKGRHINRFQDRY